MITENTLRVKIEGADDGSLKASLVGAEQSVIAVDKAQQAQAETAGKATAALHENAAAAAAAGLAAQESAAAIVSATAVTGESYDQQTARIKAAIALSLEQQAANSGIAESEASIVERAGLRTEATAAEVAATRAAVAAQDAQMVSMKAFAAAEAEATAATTRDTAAKIANTEATAINGGVAREMGVLVGEVARGNYTRLEGSTITLANRTGLLQEVFTSTGLAIAGVVGTIGLLVAAGVHAVNQEDELSRAIVATGNYADVTVHQLQGMASQLQSSGASYGQSIDVLGKLAASGKVAGDSLLTAGQAAVDMATLTGQSMDSAVSAVVRLGQDPVTAAAALNDEFHFLTAAQNEQIISLEASGNKADAAKVAFDALGAVMHARAMQAKEDAPWFTTAFNNWKQGVSNIGAGVGDILTLGGKKTEIDQYTDAVKKYNEAVKQLEMDRANGRTGLAHDLNVSSAQSAYNNVMDIWNSPDFQKERDQKQISAVVQGVQDDGVEATQTLAKLGITLDGLKTKQEKVNDAAAALYKAHLAGVNFPGVNFNGSAADLPQGAGWDAIVKKLNPPKKAKRAPEISAYDTFSSQVDALDVKSISADSAALTQYEQGIAKLADQMAIYMSKGGDATKAADLFNRGQQDLQKTLDANHVKEQLAEQQYAEALNKSNAALQLRVNNEIARIGMGDKEYQQTQQIAKAYQDEADALEKLALQRQAGINGQSGGLSQSAYEADVAALRTATAQKVQIMRTGYAAMDAAQADWTNGAKSALQNYVDQAKDVADQTKQAFTGMSTDMEDALATWGTSGKQSMDTFEKDFDNMLAHMVAKALIAQAETALLNMFAGGGGGAIADLGGNSGSFGSDMASVGGGSYGTLGAGHADGGRINGPGTGTSDSILARLSNGENVITEKATSYYGQKFMDDVNNMRLPRFAQGGPVGSSAGAGGAVASQPITVNIYGAQDGARVEQRDGGDGLRYIDVFINAAAQDVARGGRLGQAMSSAFGVQRQARSYATAGG
ncbi:phage tail tape measure protein [Rhodanobacter glycinis]|uniref:phage tail length tape measure family protein n=1 Tax=Rhodanobacter glycinis TaxID=582702 RepID=UPI00112EAF8E|nr:phage tail length tape measure family protein [Rhodanobacter glycinis]TPG50670.1 phage tail tape measure protein [Rhodanobacter glycinis]